jgi:hypothetical protein
MVKIIHIMSYKFNPGIIPIYGYMVSGFGGKPRRAITENLLIPNAAKLWLNSQAERALSHHTYHACFFLVNLFDKSFNFISLFLA